MALLFFVSFTFNNNLKILPLTYYFVMPPLFVTAVIFYNIKQFFPILIINLF